MTASGNSVRFNNRAYVDTLNPSTTEKFIEVTHNGHEQYLHEELPDLMFYQVVRQICIWEYSLISQRKYSVVLSD